MTRVTDEGVSDDSESRHGQTTTSLISSDHDGSFFLDKVFEASSVLL